MSGKSKTARGSIVILRASQLRKSQAPNCAYDSVGNRTSSHKSPTYGYQPFNRLVSTSTATYIYNNNGNMVSKTEGTGTTQYVWDFENRLTQVVTPSSGSVTYKYDALGRRIQRTPSSGISTNFIYDGQDAVKDINSDGTTIEYLNGAGIDNKIRQKGSSTATTYYFSQDHLGSTTALTGTTGKLVERITYDGYGNSADSARTRYGYTGRERDQLSGQLYYRARFYDPQLGRFISEDPMGLAAGLNFFSYIDNNPVLYGDPSGLCPQKSSASQTQPCDQSLAATERAARRVAGRIPGARVGIQGRQPVINFAGNYNQTLGQLRRAGYYSGILAYNPLDHRGGYQFRTYGSPGFHFKVIYPAVEETHVGGRLGVRVSNMPATATDLHIDCNNPVGAGIGGLINHANDFLRVHPFIRGFLGMP